MTHNKKTEMLDIISKYWYEKGHMNADQRDYFIETLLMLKPRFCLEIGFASGRSAVTTLVAANPELLVSVDLSLDYIEGARTHAEVLQRDFHNFKICEGSSIKVLNENFFQFYFPKGIDFAFIDGDHSYAGCTSDLERILPRLNKNGAILVDDYRSSSPKGVSCPDVSRAVDNFVLRNRVTLKYWHLKGKGVAYISPTASARKRFSIVLGILLRKTYYIIKSLAAKTRLIRLAKRFGTMINMISFILTIISSGKQRKYVWEWIRSNRKDYLLDRPSPWITFDAIQFVSKHIHKDMKVFEYGSGGSTLFWLAVGSDVISIENSPEWFQLLKRRLKPRDHIDFRLVMPEKNDRECDQGDPANPDDYLSRGEGCNGYNFFNYATQIDVFPDECFDLVLIDGRARPSCIKHSVAKVKIGGMLIVDDSDRSYYFTKTAKYLHNFERKQFIGVGPIMNFMRHTDVYIRKG
jgi:predicted O-methyltransferase YrrM